METPQTENSEFSIDQAKAELIEFSKTSTKRSAKIVGVVGIVIAIIAFSQGGVIWGAGVGLAFAFLWYRLFTATGKAVEKIESLNDEQVKDWHSLYVGN